MAVVIPADILSRYERLYGLTARVAVENLVARLSEADEELTDWNLRLISEARGIANVFSHAGHHDRSACEWTLNLANRLAHDALILESRGTDGAGVLSVIDETDFGLVAAALKGELSAIDGHTALYSAGWPSRGIRGLPSALASWKATQEIGDGTDGGKVAFKQTGSPSPVAPMTTAIEPTGQPVAEKTEGTVSQGVFAYKGKRAEDIQPAPWRLLEFMEGVSEADVDEAYRHAIRDDEKECTESAIKSMVREANAALEAVVHPKRLSKSKNVRHIIWS